jgi:cyclopropane-fatty-acyl-phospholipid synthase
VARAGPPAMLVRRLVVCRRPLIIPDLPTGILDVRACALLKVGVCVCDSHEVAMFPLSHLLKSFVRIGTLKVIDADGRLHVFAGFPGPMVTMRLTDRSLYHKLFFNPELHAGEAYMDGRMQFEQCGVRDFLTLFSINRVSLVSHPMQKVLRGISHTLRRLQQSNPIGRAQKNVAHHYDLGNDFYKLFLDEGMNYSCAYFLSPDETLEQAQKNKLRLIAAKLNLKLV